MPIWQPHRRMSAYNHIEIGILLHNTHPGKNLTRGGWVRNSGVGLWVVDTHESSRATNPSGWGWFQKILGYCPKPIQMGICHKRMPLLQRFEADGHLTDTFLAQQLQAQQAGMALLQNRLVCLVMFDCPQVIEFLLLSLNKTKLMGVGQSNIARDPGFGVETCPMGRAY